MPSQSERMIALVRDAQRKCLYPLATSMTLCGGPRSSEATTSQMSQFSLHPFPGVARLDETTGITCGVTVLNIRRLVRQDGQKGEDGDLQRCGSNTPFPSSI